MSVLGLQMETSSSQELTNNNSTISTHQQRQIIRGKRTKRPRPSTMTIVTSSSSTGCSGHAKNEAYFSTPSPTSSSQNNSTCTEEDEDMANCLILLAQSATCPNLIGKKFSEPATSASYVYECKTCNRNFATFQALGGHRASHKKARVPMAIPLENNKNNIVNVTTMSHKEEPVHVQFDNLQSGATIIIKAKIHECSICGSEFPSGQALGGHMRRHRTTTTTNIGITTNFNIDDDDDHRIKPIRNIVHFDLNLPAPEDDHVDSKFPFVLHGPALVGCLNQLQKTRPD